MSAHQAAVVQLLGLHVVLLLAAVRRAQAQGVEAQLSGGVVLLQMQMAVHGDRTLMRRRTQLDSGLDHKSLQVKQLDAGLPAVC